MKVNIVSKGTEAHNLKVTDSKTGNIIEGINRVELTAEAGDRIKARIELVASVNLLDVPADIIAPQMLSLLDRAHMALMEFLQEGRTSDKTIASDLYSFLHGVDGRKPAPEYPPKKRRHGNT